MCDRWISSMPGCARRMRATAAAPSSLSRLSKSQSLRMRTVPAWSAHQSASMAASLRGRAGGSEDGRGGSCSTALPGQDEQGSSAAAAPPNLSVRAMRSSRRDSCTLLPSGSTWAAAAAAVLLHLCRLRGSQAGGGGGPPATAAAAADALRLRRDSCARAAATAAWGGRGRGRSSRRGQHAGPSQVTGDAGAAARGTASAVGGQHICLFLHTAVVARMAALRLR